MDFPNSYESQYQKILFQDDQTDLYKTCDVLRKLTVFSYNAACQQKSDDATCFILKEHLIKYASLVDQTDENQINNYSDIILKIASNYKNESKNWTSHLGNPDDFVKEHLEIEKCPINNEPTCVNSQVTEDFLRKLQNNYLKWEEIEKEKNQGFRSLTNNSSEHKKEISNQKQNSFNKATSNSFNFNQDFPRETNNFLTRDEPSTSREARSNTMRPAVSKFQPMQPQQQALLEGKKSSGFFKTARDELCIQNQKKWGRENGNGNEYRNTSGGYGAVKRNLGTRRGGNVNKKFVPPVRSNQDDDFEGKFGIGTGYQNPTKRTSSSQEEEFVEDERLRGICPKMIEMIRNEIMDSKKPIGWDDIAGLEFAKTTIQEIVVWPLLRPDIFTGLRRPPKGILLFGPPGTGKTLIGKCIASQSHSTFFSISASSLTSKWIGDGEKMVRALFAVARVHQPSVVFIDEIDSLLTQRSDTEHESSRRIKTEFLVQLDGTATSEEDRILIVGATNRPQELDEAARRRLVKRLYIPLPDFQARKQIVERLLANEKNNLTPEEIDDIAKLTDGYSGADMKNVCSEASLGPIRSIGLHEIGGIQPEQVRPVNVNDFTTALKRVRASVSPNDLESYVTWDRIYGSGGNSAL